MQGFVDVTGARVELKEMKPHIKQEVLVINDKAVFNTGYRAGLLGLLAENNFAIKSFGFFETGRPSLGTIMKVAFKRSKPIISSNLRTNVIALSFFWLRGLTIINGLGRHRGKKSARKLLIFLMKSNKRRSIVIQSYADYRYFRRHTNKAKVSWIPGSGGSEKKHKSDKSLICVQRDDKISLVSENIKHLLAATKMNSLTVVGCRNEENVQELFNGYDIKCPGYLPANDILKHGGVFVQPSGYGEGFPHTLADAIVSQMEIYISGQEYIRYGLMHLGFKRSAIGRGWYKLIYTATACKQLSLTAINQRYFDTFLNEINGAQHDND